MAILLFVVLKPTQKILILNNNMDMVQENIVKYNN